MDMKVGTDFYSNLSKTVLDIFRNKFFFNISAYVLETHYF